MGVVDSHIRRDAVTGEPGRAPLALIFDSGVGGLSVLHEVAALLPGIRLAYAADNLAFPYGGKSEDELVARVTGVIGRLVAETAPDVVVIACNTASTTALDAVRQMIAIPVVGVVPAIKPAAQSSVTRTIGLLGTAATVATPYTRGLIEQFAQGCRVVLRGAPELVEAAEEKMQGRKVDPAAIDAVIDRLFGAPGGEAIDIVVLGCTHFPLLRDELSASAPRPVSWIDSGAAIARRVATILNLPEQAQAALPVPHRAIFTAETAGVERMRGALAGFGLTEIGFLKP